MSDRWYTNRVLDSYYSAVEDDYEDPLRKAIDHALVKGDKNLALVMIRLREGQR